MPEAVIVEAVRTPIAKSGGRLKDVRPDSLGAVVLRALVERTGIAPTAVEDVIFGCVTQIGEQSPNVARTALLVAGWPETIPGTTVDRKCGSSQQAAHFAAALVQAGVHQAVIAGGVESMSRVPMGSNRQHGEPWGPRCRERFAVVSQGEAAEMVAERWRLTRPELDEFGLQSHLRAAAAIRQGRFAAEVVPVPVHQWRETPEGPAEDWFDQDQCVRLQPSLEKMASLPPVFRPDGVVSAGTSSQISDGAAALLITSREWAVAHGLRPRARLRAQAVVGVDPTMMLTGPIPATAMVLARAGLQLSDIDLFEVNEAFAPVVLAWQRETGADPARVNVSGGAIALGHPLGASGARLLTTALHELERRDAQLGLVTMCCAGGLGVAAIIDREV